MHCYRGGDGGSPGDSTAPCKNPEPNRAPWQSPPARTAQSQHSTCLRHRCNHEWRRRRCFTGRRVANRGCRFRTGRLHIDEPKPFRHTKEGHCRVCSGTAARRPQPPVPRQPQPSPAADSLPARAPQAPSARHRQPPTPDRLVSHAPKASLASRRTPAFQQTRQDCFRSLPLLPRPTQPPLRSSGRQATHSARWPNRQAVAPQRVDAQASSRVNWSRW